MDHTNKAWEFYSKDVEFVTEASDISLRPGAHPNTQDILDPWGRVVDSDWQTMMKGESVATFVAFVLSPDLKWAKLVILND